MVGVEHVRFSPDGTRVASTSADGRLTVWNTAGEVLHEYVPSSHLSAACSCLAWCPAFHSKKPNNKKKKKKAEGDSEGDLIALGTSAGTVLLYSVKQGDLVTTLEAGLATVRIQSVVWSHSSTSILAGGEDGLVTIFSVIDLDVRARFKAGKEPIFALAVTADDKKIITGSRKIRVWDVSNQRLLQTFTGHASPLTCLSTLSLGSDDEEEYVISCGADDRTVSIWHISETEKPEKGDPVHNTLAVNDTVREVVTFSESEDGGQITSVATQSGLLVLFRHNVAAKRKKPAKPNQTLSLATAATAGGGGKEVAHQMAVLASRISDLEDPQVTFAYGTSLKICVETLPLAQINPQHCLVREAPALRLGGEVQTEFTKVVNPQVTGAVNYLTPGTILPRLTTKLGKRKPDAGSVENMTLEERLALLNTSSLSTKSPPRADTLVQLLIQGLQGKDLSILDSVFDRADEELIDNTVRKLPVEHVLALITTLQRYIKGRGSSNLSHARWLRSALAMHTGYLVSVPDAAELLGPLYAMLEARTANYKQVLQLKGKLDMMNKQRARINEASDVRADRDALLVYQDDSSDELSDVIDSLLVPSNDTDDELEHINSFMGEDEDEDDEDEDEDDEDDVVEVARSDDADSDAMDAD